MGQVKIEVFEPSYPLVTFLCRGQVAINSPNFLWAGSNPSIEVYEFNVYVCQNCTLWTKMEIN